MTVLRSVMLGCGSYLPGQILTNEELARKVDTSDDWIVQRTGIHERRIAAPGEHTSHMAIRAAQAALAHAHVDAQSIDLIVLATSTPDNTFPASAVSVQAGLGITHGAAFDLPEQEELVKLAVRYLADSGQLFIWGIGLPSKPSTE